MVIQHADSITQEKYLPLMRNAVKQNKALANQLAMLEDRVLLRRGLKQIYGTQVFWDDAGKKWVLSPIEDQKDVDKKRAQVELPPIKDYLKYFGIDYSGTQVINSRRQVVAVSFWRPLDVIHAMLKIVSLATKYGIDFLRYGYSIIIRFFAQQSPYKLSAEIEDSLKNINRP